MLWLNRDVSRRTARLGGVAIGLIITLFIILSGYVFINCISVQIYIKSRTEPPRITCDELNKTQNEKSML